MDSYGGPSSSAGIDLPGRIRKRRYSTARIQPTRIKKVMQSDEEIGRMIASVPVAIGSVMEHFAERLLENSAMVMHESASKTLAPGHICTAINRTPYYAFLQPLIKNLSGASVQSPSINGLVGKPFEVYPLNPASSLEEKYDINTHMRDTAKIHQASTNNIVASSSDDTLKRRRGRPRKDVDSVKEKSKELPIIPNGISSSADLDRELMPPPMLIPKRKAVSSSVITPNALISNNNSTTLPSTTSSTSSQPPTTDAISA